MKNEDCMKPFGLIIKEEPLSLINENLCYKNYTVLESDAPFSGYYNEHPSEQHPQYLYLIIDDKHSIEDVLMAGINIRENQQIDFEDAYSELKFEAFSCKAIRIRHLNEYSLISQLQSFYSNQGISLKHKQASLIKENTIIKLYKTFNFVEIEDGIYYDSIEAHHAYFDIDKFMSWDEFKSLIKETKYETSLLNFDAAYVSIFCHNKIITLVRIYKEFFKVEDILAIKNRINVVLNKQIVI